VKSRKRRVSPATTPTYSARKLVSGSVAGRLIDRLVERGIGDPVSLRLDDGERILPLLVMEDDEVRRVLRRPVRDRDLHADPLRLVAVPVDQLGPELGPDLFFRIVVDLGLADGLVRDLRLDTGRL
jgi:hypothetical protein